MLLISSDYDGTFDNSLFNIRVNNLRIKKFRSDGNIFMINTGRCFKNAKLVTDQYKIPYTYLAAGDGTSLYNEKDELIYFNKLDSKMIDEYLFFAQENKLGNIDFLYEEEYSKRYIDCREIGSVSLTVERRDLSTELREAFKELERKHPDYVFSIYYGNGVAFLTIKSKGINKTLPIRFIQDKYGIHSKDIFTIGDELNDLEMIREFNGFHVGNNPEVIRHSLGQYRAVYQMMDDIMLKKVKRRR